MVRPAAKREAVAFLKSAFQMSERWACSSASSLSDLRWVERCWPSTEQARRSETPRLWRTCSMQSRRREGLKK